MFDAATKTKDGFKTALLCEIAHLYYMEGLNQQQIAEKLGLGRSSVARHLTEARNLGIVQIKIADTKEFYRNSSLEEQLRRKYRLSDCLVATSMPPHNYHMASADYIRSVLPQNATVAVGGGATLYSIGQYLKKNEDGNKMVFIQSTGIVNESVPSTAVVQTWSMKMDGTPIYMSYPGIMHSVEAKKMIQDDGEFSNKYNIMKNADACVVGIGTIEQFLTTGEKLVSSLPGANEEISNSVGDICFQLFDANGDFCSPSLAKYVCGLSIMDFLRIPIRIAAAVGEQKIAAIYGALKGRLPNVLLTDDQTAQKLLEMDA